MLYLGVSKITTSGALSYQGRGLGFRPRASQHHGLIYLGMLTTQCLSLQAR